MVCRRILVPLQGNKLGFRATPIGQGKAQSAGNGMPFPRTATRHWPIGAAPCGPAGKRPSALLHSFELASASPALARLASDRFPTGCILSYYLGGVLVLFQHDNAGFSAPVVLRSKAQCAGNGLSPCQARQRGCGTPEARPTGESVSVPGQRCVSWQGLGHSRRDAPCQER